MKHWFLCIFYLLVIWIGDSAAGSDNNLPLCPSSPNCISSQQSDTHFIQPFPMTENANAAFSELKDLLGRREDTTIVSTTDNTIRVEFRTTLGFVDDGIFVLDENNKVIHVRSASRIGYWDMGKNRRRMETIRQEYQTILGGGALRSKRSSTAH